MKYIFLMLFILLLLTHSLATANITGSVNGFVYDATNGEALIGANIFLQDTQIGASSNVSGYFSIPRIPAGPYFLECHYIGFKPYSKKINITPGKNIELKIFLHLDIIETEEIIISADSVRTSKRLFDKAISKVNLAPRQINRIPQVFEADLLRSLHTLPGILPISDFSSELYVRGGTPDQNLYLIDGADVYNPEHFFGLFSTFNTDAIKNVELSKGGFGAEYGGRLSSILDVTNLDGNREEFEGTASVSLLSAKTTLQMPIGKKGSLSGSIRRTYFDKTIAKFIDDVPDYYFYDGHFKAFLDLDSRNKLTVSTYFGRDKLDFELDTNGSEPIEFSYDWGNTTGSVRWTHIFNPNLFSNFWVTTSQFNSDFLFEIVNEKNEINDLSLKGDLEYYYSHQISTKFGFEFKNLDGLLYQDFPGGEVDVVHAMKHLACYSTATWRPNPLWNIEAGLRYNYFHSNTTYQNISPRFSLKYRLTDTINLKTALGSYRQFLFKIPRTFIVDIWTNADENYRNSSSNHYILGFQKEVAKDYEIEIEGYYKDYSSIYTLDHFFYTELQPARYNSNGEPVYGSSLGLFDQGNGHSYGLEFSLRKDTGFVTGWASASFGKTEYTIQGVNQGKSFVPRHDRTTTLNLIANMDIRNAYRTIRRKVTHNDRTTWRLGMGLVYATGQPLTTTSSVYISQPLPDQNYIDSLNLYPTARNNFRLPPYARFDISLTMEKKFRSWTLSPYLQVFNAGNRKNLWFITYDREIIDNKLVQEIEPINMFPILPTIGVNIKF